MGVDIRCFLDHRASLRAIETVVGQLLGQPVVKANHGAGDFLTVKGTRLVGCAAVPGLVDVLVKAPKGRLLTNGEGAYSLTIHLETSDNDQARRGCKAFIPRSAAFDLAVATRLVRHFGGWLDFDDSDEVEFDMVVPFHRSVVGTASNAAGEAGSLAWSNAGFDAWWGVKPITPAEIAAADQHAVYKLND